MLKVFLAASLVGLAAAECPNACSGHGTCGVFDMCTCFRNWQASDCSHRTCPFDLAHVDTPKGDLNHDSTISSTPVVVDSTVYPAGTPEQFPTAPLGNAGVAVYTSAHYYMECSNKGICDRTTGECECFDGYDGTACNRASCPNDCSGHGTCETIGDLAFGSFQNVYALWDKDATMGCNCDDGYTAADCSQRTCKTGIDPLYVDDVPARYPQTLIQIRSTAASELGGTFTITYYDETGEGWDSNPINVNGGGTVDGTTTAAAASGISTAICAGIEEAFRAFPNEVFPNTMPKAKFECTAVQHDTNKGWDVTLTLPAGEVKPLTVNSASVTATSGFTVNVAGIVNGENTDYFASRCSTVTAVIKNDASFAIKSGSLGHLEIADAAHVKLLKACLGDSDGDLTNNVEVYNWDYGSMKEFADITAKASTDATVNVVGSFPHAIKAVPISGSTAPQLHLVWYDDAPVAAGEEFRVVSRQAEKTVAHYIHTTNGIVQQLGWDRNPSVARATGFVGAGLADSEMSNNKTEVRVVGYFSKYSNKVYTNIDASCESTNTYLSQLHNCIQKGDRLFIIHGCWGDGTGTNEYFGGQTGSCADTAAGDATAGTANYLYTVNKIYSKPFDVATDAIFPDGNDADAVTAVGGTAGDLITGATVTANYAGVNAVNVGYENRFVIEVDQNINWDGDTHKANPGNSIDAKANSGFIVLFKFTPAADGAGSYTYVSECSNRGACDRETGLCQCFKGYTADNCSVQSSLAV